jgi:hypothetical protein
VIVQLSGQKFTVSLTCACCHGDSNTEVYFSHTRTSGKRVVRETTKGFSFPYCTGCDAHSKMWEGAGALAVVSTLIGALLGVIVGIASNAPAGFAVFALTLPIAIIIKGNREKHAQGLCKPSCVVPGYAVKFLGWEGTAMTFNFSSIQFATEFAAANQRKLINTNHTLQSMIQQYQTAATSGGAAKTPTSSPPLADLAKTGKANLPAISWLEKIESVKGAVTRKKAVENALLEITEPTARRDFLCAVSRIETAAVLDKVDTLTSNAAKKRHLENAIRDIEADSLPDELQAEELRQLREQLSRIVGK